MNCAADLVGLVSTDELLLGLWIALVVTAAWWWYCGLFGNTAIPLAESGEPVDMTIEQTLRGEFGDGTYTIADPERFAKWCAAKITAARQRTR